MRHLKRLAMAMAIALLAPAQCWAQGAEPAGDILDPATVRWQQVEQMTVIVYGCSNWPDSFIVCPAAHAPPPQACTFGPPQLETVFDLLAGAHAVPGVEPPPPSQFFHFTILMKLKDRRTLVASIPLYPEEEEDGDRYLWMTYSDRRVRLDRASWDRISELAQSRHCAHVEVQR